MVALARAADLGYHDLEELESQPRLDPLRKDPRWQNIRGRVEAARAAWLRTVQPEIYAMYQQDQADRTRKNPTGIDWVDVGRRDAEHRQRLRQLIASSAAKVAADYYHAAMIFQHGTAPADFHDAHELALKAVELDSMDRAAKWLAAATEDRELMNLDRPQRYGTQFRKVNGQWTLYPVDPGVTDAERAKWNVPPLASAKKHVDRMNARPR